MPCSRHSSSSSAGSARRISREGHEHEIGPQLVGQVQEILRLAEQLEAGWDAIGGVGGVVEEADDREGPGRLNCSSGSTLADGPTPSTSTR